MYSVVRLLSPILALLLFSSVSSAKLCREVFRTFPEAAMPSRARLGSLPIGLNLEDFPDNSTSRVFVEYAVRNLLLQQSEDDLGQLGLLVPNGGLCATASITNVLGAMMATEENFIEIFHSAPYATEQLVDWYTSATERDARLGANVPILTDIVSQRWQELKSIFLFNRPLEDISMSVARYTSEFYPYRIQRYLRGDSIGIMVVHPAVESTSSRENFHAMVLLGFDLENKKIIFSDPNNPNQIISAPFDYTQGTDIRFRAPFTFGDEFVEIYSLDVLTRNHHSFL